MTPDMPWRLKALPRWCFSGTEQDGAMAKAPFYWDKVGRKFAPLDVTRDHDKLLTWDDLVEVLADNPERDFGFVLTNGDGITCLDIDIQDNWTPEMCQAIWNTVCAYETYTEASRSGAGYHLWFRGEIEGSYKQGGFEVYARDRFIICTGNGIGLLADYDLNNDPEHIAVFNQRIAQSRKSGDIDLEEFNEEATASDSDVITQCFGHDNTGKFECLWTGDWSRYVEIMESQRDGMQYDLDMSQCDAAFMTIVSFYTSNVEQCKRIWRESALGNLKRRYPGNAKKQREKRNRHGCDDVLHRALRLAISRNHKDAEVRKAQSEHGQKLAMEAKLKRAAVQGGVKEEHSKKLELPPLFSKELTYPPGRMGILAKYFYDASLKQIKEFAILEALSLIAGITGRTYNVSMTGLNCYFMVLAASGTGKSELTKNPQNLLRHMERSQGIIGASRFVSSERFTHENSMFASFKEESSYVQVLSEFGKIFRNMVGQNAGAQGTVREQMTDVYSKSGMHDVVGGIRYTNAEKSVHLNYPVAFSFLGESVPEPFFEAVTKEAFADGFVSRFIFSEYAGEIPYDNPNRVAPTHQVEQIMTDVLLPSIKLLGSDPNVVVTPIHVGMEPEVAASLSAFTKYCTDMQNRAREDIVWNSMWSRSNLKTLKVAALLAAFENPHQPTITKPMLDWAWNFINRHNHLVWGAVAEGRVAGDGTSTERMDYIEKLLYDVYSSEHGKHHSHKRMSKKLFDDCVMPRSVLARMLRGNMFKDSMYKSRDDLINSTLTAMAQNGIIQVVSQREMQEKYGGRTVGYRFIGSDMV